MSESLLSQLDHRKSFSVREVAELTGFSARIIQKYAKEGVIPAFQPRSGRRARWRFKRDALERWWAKQDK